MYNVLYNVSVLNILNSLQVATDGRRFA